MKKLSDLSINGKAKAQVNILEKSEDNSEINRIRKHMGYQGRTRNYYPRPSFPDLQFEEARDMVASSYSGNSIIEWNIDGHSEQNILNTIQEMTMAATAFKSIGENSDRKAAILIITGFTGQLKGWWDNIISPEEKLAILEAKKLDPSTGIIGDEDAVNTLLYTITKHFVGDPAQIQDRAADQLANLYCPTMSDYRWYKDMFLSKLCNRPDGGADYWKERFIAGLPRIICLPLFKRLKKNPPPWDDTMSQSIRQIKQLVKRLPCLGIPDPQAFLIVETDSSDLGFGGILKQKLPESSLEQVVRYYSGTWNPAQLNYSTIKKEVLAIVLCITKFQDDLFSKKFLLRSDCKAAKEVLQKDVKNLVSKHIFARWQALLSCFDFDIEHIKGEKNSLPDYLTREFLQGK
ncbi:unnamed protein product [Trifolium pratense]|uniref:Uncharacterized protein n=1 Tax=Trifolium pratense TaxID=57577 RepID=A0ACB0LRJ0_TRIPR|nr:unnamed protein product [Trifolium pratense]